MGSKSEPELGHMSIGLELVVNRLGLHHPLVGTVPALVDELRGLVTVHGVDLAVGVTDIGAVDFEALDEHPQEQKSLLHLNTTSSPTSLESSLPG